MKKFYFFQKAVCLSFFLNLKNFLKIQIKRTQNLNTFHRRLDSGNPIDAFYYILLFRLFTKKTRILRQRLKNFLLGKKFRLFIEREREKKTFLYFRFQITFGSLFCSTIGIIFPSFFVHLFFCTKMQETKCVLTTTSEFRVYDGSLECTGHQFCT